MSFTIVKRTEGRDLELKVIALAGAGLAALFAVTGLASAAEEHRQLGAHEHGHGTLNIAVDGKALSMELVAPGDDIVGFEHEPSTPEQKATVDKASLALGKPLDLFKVPESAGCKVGQAKVETRPETEHDDDDAKGAPAHGTDAHDKDAKGGESHEGHNEWHATYLLECTSPANLTAIEFTYFKAFANPQKLTVGLVTPKAQSSFEVTRDKPVLDLGGMM